MAFFYGGDGPSRFNKQNGKLSFDTVNANYSSERPLPKIRGAYTFTQEK